MPAVDRPSTEPAPVARSLAECVGTPAVTREALFGGVGAVKIWDLLGAQVAVPFSAVLYCELTAGGSVGQHRQERDHEFVLSLEGEADVTVGGRTQRLGPGQLVYLGQGDVLAIENSSTEQPFRYLIVKAQPSP